MSVNLVLFHHSSPSPHPLVLPKGYWHMATCLRSIVLAETAEPLPVLKDYQIYENEQAFEFLLQVICGLHSPLVGETEIFGQFKQFLKENQESFSPQMHEALTPVLKEAKKIRTEFLQNLGCTSYGSLLRKHIDADESSLNILGAGSLVEDILPWFAKKKTKIHVVTRSPEKYSSLDQRFNNVSLTGVEDIKKLKGKTLVIAAPFSSHWLKEKVNLESYTQVFDLRGESQKDPLSFSHVTSLKSLFADIETNKKQASQTKDHALQAIKDCAIKISLIEKQRPFGWEDLWACS